VLNKSDLHEYQHKGVKHILEHKNSALFLDMGLGKTITTLTAIEELIYKDVEKVLIIAPLRVCNSVWVQEAENWEHTTYMSFTNLSGGSANMLKGLKESSDIYLINRENVKALIETTKGKWDFDMVVIDESSSFKSYSSQRFKALKKVLHLIDKMVLLTGTPSPNGYMDLWSQIYLLDRGERLGKNITAFRNRYFTKDFMGWSYEINPYAPAKIQSLIKDVAISMSSEDYLELPDFIPTVLENKLSGKLLKQYKEFEKEMLLDLDGELITAMSAATLSNKLLQFCSGNIYGEDGQIHHFHELKLDTLQEIIDSSPDENLLVGYNYKHELTALKKKFPDAVVLDKEGKAVEQWNRGEIKLLLAHPASAGHGLNLQKGGKTLIWYGFTWSLELYQQFNKRLHRQGQKDNVRCIHITVGDIEYKLMKTLSQKDATQQQLLDNLKG
jgi:SNF2 family DNA or RNA helicase